MSSHDNELEYTTQPISTENMSEALQSNKNILESDPQETLQQYPSNHQEVSFDQQEAHKEFSQDEQQANHHNQSQLVESDAHHHPSDSEIKNSNLEDRSIEQDFEESHPSGHEQLSSTSIERHSPELEPIHSHKQLEPSHQNLSSASQSKEGSTQDQLADISKPLVPHLHTSDQEQQSDHSHNNNTHHQHANINSNTSSENINTNHTQHNSNDIITEEASQDMHDIEGLFSEPLGKHGDSHSYNQGVNDIKQHEPSDHNKKRSFDQGDDIVSESNANNKKSKSDMLGEDNIKHAVLPEEDHTMNDLDLQFEKAIENHHRETSKSPAAFPDQHQHTHVLHMQHNQQHKDQFEDDNVKERLQQLSEQDQNAQQSQSDYDEQKDVPKNRVNQQQQQQQLEQEKSESALINEKEDLQMIANELEQATLSKTRQYIEDEGEEEEDDEREKAREIEEKDVGKENEADVHEEQKEQRETSAASSLKNATEVKNLSDMRVGSDTPNEPSAAEARTANSPGAAEPIVSAESTSTSTKPHVLQVNNESVSNEIDAKKSLDSSDPIPRHSYIPANSELFNTNAAFVAYNELSSQLPPLAALSNAQLTLLPLPIVAADYLPPRIQLLVNTLPTLDNLASQLLRIVALGPYQKIIDLASNPTTPAGATYRDLTSLFEFTKKLYTEEDPFLTVEHIAPGMWKEGDRTPEMFRSREQSIESTLRKVNLATFLAAILGTIEVGFFYLNESFLDVFCPANNLDPDNALSNMSNNNSNLQATNATIGETVGKLLKPQAVLYLDLKTQAYISAIEAGERSHQEILEDIFPSDLEYYLQTRRNTKILSPVESDFVARCRSRKQTLLEYPMDRNLGDEYEWFSFLSNLIEYVAKNMGFLIWGKKGKGNFKLTSATGYRAPTSTFNSISTTSEPSKTIPIANTSASAVANTSTSHTKSSTPHSMELLQSFKDKPESNKDDKIATGSNSTEFNDKDPRDRQIKDLTSALLPSEILEQQIHLRINPNTTIKSLNRRPWSREEEKALRHALELKGPSWSTILGLFGAGGKISEALKNRSQVQLKDKARNWKMFFLKSGLPVPTYLQKVTGDLEREDRLRARSNRSKKTAAAPVPNPSARGGKAKADTTVGVDPIAEASAAATKSQDENKTNDNSVEQPRLEQGPSTDDGAKVNQK